MEQLDQIAKTLSMTMGAAWASGINLYAAMLVLGILGTTGNIVLPEGLSILMNPMVIGAAGIMYIAEFVADKIPIVDNGWDTIHTFIRIPAGVLMAAGAVGDVDPAVAIAAGICGGGIAATSHAFKAGSRVIINTSPEPVTNWTASIAEDVAVVGGIWTALNQPWLFLLFLVLFLVLVIWLLPKIWRGIKKVFGFVGRLFGFGKTETAPNGSPAVGVDGILDSESTRILDSENYRILDSENYRILDSGSTRILDSDDIENKIAKLKGLLDKGLISPEEFQSKKSSLLDEL